MHADESKPVILFADDSKTVRKQAAKVLEERYSLLEAEDGKQALELLELNPSIRIVFADLQMPGMNGMQLLQAIRSNEAVHITQLPVIMITGHDDSEAAMHVVFDMGATDFIAKPFRPIDLLSKAYSFVHLTNRLLQLEQESGTDSLTGLANNFAYFRSGEKTLSLAKRHNLPCTICYLEVEKLSMLYKQHGRIICDKMVVTIAERIDKHLRKEDFVARIGMSRFAIILPMTNTFKAQICIKRIVDTVHNITFDIGHASLRIDVACGITGTEGDETDISLNELSLQADTALQLANSKVNHIALYHDSNSNDKDISMTSDPFLSALEHIRNGEFEKILRKDVDVIREKFTSFVQHIEQAYQD